MEKINLKLVMQEHALHGIENVLEYENLESFNKYVEKIASQADWKSYFPLEAKIIINGFYGEYLGSVLVRLTKPYEIVSEDYFKGLK